MNAPWTRILMRNVNAYNKSTREGLRDEEEEYERLEEGNHHHDDGHEDTNGDGDAGSSARDSWNEGIVR